MISVGKQLFEQYDLFETSVGLRSSRRMGREDESIPCCLPGPAGSRVLLLNCSLWGRNGKDHTPAHWERIWKAVSQGQGFVSGELVSSGRSFCNWKEIMNFWEPEFLRDNQVTNFQHKSTMRNVLIILYPVWVWIWYTLIFLVFFRYLNSKCETERLWGMHEG